MLDLAGRCLVPVAAVLIIKNDGSDEPMLPLSYLFLDLHLGKGLQMNAELRMVVERTVIGTAVKIDEQVKSSDTMIYWSDLNMTRGYNRFLQQTSASKP